MELQTETSTLPELSFEDLLDDSPIKKPSTAVDSEQYAELYGDSKKSDEDESLNTPKRKIKLVQKIVDDEQQTSIATTPKVVTAKITTATTSNVKGNLITSKPHTTMPILLSNKTSATQGVSGAQKIFKISTAAVAASSAGGTEKAVGASTTSIKPQTISSVTTIGGKTAIKTSNGQIVYIQKTQTTPGVGINVSNATTSNATTVRLTTATLGNASTSGTKLQATNKSGIGTTTTTTTPVTAGVGNKTVAIQFVRSADGKLVPLKSATTVKNTVTLSPTVAAQLACKKLISSTGNQVVFKATTSIAASGTTPATSTSTAIANAKPIKIQKIMTPTGSTSTLALATKASTTTTTVSTTAGTPTSTITISKPLTASTTSTTAGGKIFVQGNNGKQIVVQNSQLIKLSPKPGATAGGSTAINTGKVHAIQIPGKTGVQYVRVVSANKSATTTTTATAISSNSGAGTTTTSPTTTTTASVKFLNRVPSKFTVVRPNQTGKIILTNSPKTDGTASSLMASPISTTKVQKTIVTVPTLRTINNLNESSVTPTTTTAGDVSPTKSQFLLNKSSSNPTSITILRSKPKFSEINSEIKRLTAGSSDVKKFVSGPDGKRYLVMPRSMLQQQTQQKATDQTSSSSTTTTTTKVIVKSSTSSNSTGSGGTVAAASADGGMKSFIICKTNPKLDVSLLKSTTQVKKPLLSIHQQQKVQQQQQQQKQQQQSQESKNEQKQSLTQIISSKNQTNKLDEQLSSIGTNKFIPIKIKDEPLDGDDLSSMMYADDPLARGGIRRKHCNCSKSQCLKLYCDCFANGEFCQDCTCKDCFNSLQYEDERSRAIKTCLERNPSAFKPKITSAADQADTRLHNKGCNCKRSGCLKNYCECFEAKIPCSSNCKCVGCRNIEDRPDLDMDPIDPKILETIANASNATNNIARAVSSSNTSVYGGAIKRSFDRSRKSELDGSDLNQFKMKKKRVDIDGSAALFASPQLSDEGDIDGDGEDMDDEEEGKETKEKRNTNFITQEVIDATIQCMISQADECLKNNLPPQKIEKLVIEELGRCLVEIIDFSIRNTDNSFSQS